MVMVPFHEQVSVQVALYTNNLCILCVSALHVSVCQHSYIEVMLLQQCTSTVISVRHRGHHKKSNWGKTTNTADKRFIKASASINRVHEPAFFFVRTVMYITGTGITYTWFENRTAPVTKRQSTRQRTTNATEINR